MARRVHWPKRNGWKSCRLVCSKAGVIASTAENGKVHLGQRVTHSKVLRIATRIKSIRGKKKTVIAGSGAEARCNSFRIAA
jgi:hypothetical protein